MFSQILEAIKSYNTIIIHRHSRPDGDAMGSQIGLAQLIKDNFDGKKVYMVGDTSSYLSFMDGAIMDDIPDEIYQGALAIVCDCGANHLIYDARYKLAEKTIRFDHHLFVDKICDIEVIDSTFESCCGLITQFAKECNLTLSKASATALYTGMVTDSGRFRFDCTNERTLALASLLLAQGIDLNTLYYNLYTDSYEALKRKAANILRIRFTEHNVAYLYNTAEEVKSSGLEFFSVSRGYVGHMADIKGVYAWVNITEGDDGIYCELRSNRYNINPIAVKYGGGGHKKASGCKVESYEKAMALVQDLDELVKLG